MGNSLNLSTVHFPVNVSGGAQVTPTEELALTCIKTDTFLGRIDISILAQLKMSDVQGIKYSFK